MSNSLINLFVPRIILWLVLPRPNSPSCSSANLQTLCINWKQILLDASPSLLCIRPHHFSIEAKSIPHAANNIVWWIALLYNRNQLCLGGYTQMPTTMQGSFDLMAATTSQF
jgi:hypothetical protein